MSFLNEAKVLSPGFEPLVPASFICGIFIIYMGFRRAIYNDIASSTSDFFRPRIKNALVQGRALGHFLTLEEKKTSVSGLYRFI